MKRLAFRSIRVGAAARSRRRSWWLAAVSALFCASATFAAHGSDAFELRWEWAEPAGYFSRSRVSIVDVDGDGVQELLTPGCFNRCWIAHQRNGDGFRQVASSPAAYNAFDWFTFPGDSGSVDSVLAYDSYEPWIEIGTLDQGKIETRRVDIVVDEALDGIVVDVDGDFDPELILINSTDLFVYDFDSGQHEATRYGFGGYDLAAGQLDGDPQLEVVVASGYGSCWALDGISSAVDWGTPSGCGSRIELGQVFPDSPLEIVTSFVKDYQYLRLFDPPSTVPVWTVPSPPGWWSWPSFIVEDLDPLPGAEVVVAHPYDSTELLRGDDGSLIRTYDSYDSGVFGAGDLDGDGEHELLIGSSSFSSEQPLEFLDPLTGALESRFPEFDLSSGTADAGDVDGDGDREFVVGGRVADESGYMKAALHLFAGTLGGGPATLRIPTSYPHTEGRADAVAVGDVDGDVDPEIFVGYDIGSSFLASLDGFGAERWRLQLPSSAWPLGLFDIAGNGESELLFGKRTYNSFAAVTNLRADLGWLNWQSPDIGDTIDSMQRLCHGVFEGIPTERIAVLDNGSSAIQMLDASSGLSLGAAAVGYDATSLICSDLDGDAQLELIASRSDGTVVFVDPISGGWGAQIAMVDEPVHSIDTADYLGVGSPQIAAVVTDAIHIIDPVSGIVLVSVAFSGRIDSYFGRLQSIELDGDETFELVVRSEEKLSVFGLPSASPVLLVDGFESANTTYWSAIRP